jgi:hypothetical protein
METDSQTLTHKYLLNISNYALGAALVCYLTGFAMTNLYLGSLGIMNLDILRSRYILTGLLFIIFLGAIAYLTNGLVQTLIKTKSEPIWKALVQAVRHSFENLVTIYIVIVAISIFAGTANNFSNGLPNVTSNVSFKKWEITEPVSSLRGVAVLFLIGALVFIFLSTLIILINPRVNNGNRQTRKTIFLETWGWAKNNIIKLLSGLLLLYFGIVICFIIFSFLRFTSTGEVSTTSSQSVFFLQGGWTRFLGTIIAAYILIATFLLFIVFGPNFTKDNQENPLFRLGA